MSDDYPETRYDWDSSGNIIYKGELVQDTRKNRLLYKITHYQYDASNNLIKKFRPMLAHWADRTTIKWG